MGSKKKGHKLTLSDDAWGHAHRHAALNAEYSSASDVCETLLRQYYRAAQAGMAPESRDLSHIERDQRTVYLTDETWGNMQLQKVKEKRSVSEILEQLLRSHLELGFESDELLPNDAPDEDDDLIF